MKLDRLIEWMNECWIDWLIDWMNEWMLDWLIDWLACFLCTEPPIAHLLRRVATGSPTGVVNCLACCCGAGWPGVGVWIPDTLRYEPWLQSIITFFRLYTAAVQNSVRRTEAQQIIRLQLYKCANSNTSNSLSTLRGRKKCIPLSVMVTGVFLHWTQGEFRWPDRYAWTDEELGVPPLDADTAWFCFPFSFITPTVAWIIYTLNPKPSCFRFAPSSSSKRFFPRKYWSLKYEEIIGRWRLLLAHFTNIMHCAVLGDASLMANCSP